MMIKRRRDGGFSLVELKMVVAMIGILCAIGFNSWVRYVKKSRTGEAVGHLSKMWTGAMAYYEADHASSAGTMLTKQFPGDCVEVIEPDCCDPSNGDGRCKGSDPVYQLE